MYHVEGRGRNQIRLEIPVLATAGHPDISGTQPAAQFGEGAPFIEVPIHTVRRKHIGRQRSFTKPVGTCSSSVRLTLVLRSRSRSRACSSSVAVNAACN